MFYSKGMSHLRFPLENNKGDDDDNDNYDDSALFTLLPCIQPRCTAPDKMAPP